MACMMINVSEYGMGKQRALHWITAAIQLTCTQTSAILSTPMRPAIKVSIWPVGFLQF